MNRTALTQLKRTCKRKERQAMKSRIDAAPPPRLDIPEVVRIRGGVTGDPELDNKSPFEVFREYVCRYKSYPHHKDWEELLNTGQDSRYLRGIAGQDLLILAPRESAKSTYLIDWCAYQIGRHVEFFGIDLKILYISFEVKTAMQKSQQIQRVLLTEQYQNVFPKIQKGENWAQERWEINRGYAGLDTTSEPYTVVCAGLKGTSTGKRAHLLILDDLIKTPDSIKSPLVRQEMINNWNHAIKYVRFDGSRAICLGTRMTPSDLYCTTFVVPKWFVVEQSALLVDPVTGEEYSYWEPQGPDAPGTPLVTLQEERNEDPISFSYQRQNKIVRIDEQTIDPSLCDRGLVPLDFDALVLGCDLAAGKSDGSAYTAMVMGGVRWGENNRPEYWIIDAWEDRVMGNITKLNTMVEMWERWKHLLPQTQRLNPDEEWEECPVIGLEMWFDSNAYGRSLEGDYNDYILGEMGIVDWKVVPSPSSHKGTKLERLLRHSGLFNNHLIHFNSYSRKMSDGRQPMGRLIEQITSDTGYYDLMDALDLCLSGLRTRRPLSKGNYL